MDNKRQFLRNLLKRLKENENNVLQGNDKTLLALKKYIFLFTRYSLTKKKSSACTV